MAAHFGQEIRLVTSSATIPCRSDGRNFCLASKPKLVDGSSNSPLIRRIVRMPLALRVSCGKNNLDRRGVCQVTNGNVP